MELAEIRKQLDVIDSKLMELLAERQSHMKGVAEYKKLHNLPLTQPEREKAILVLRMEQAEKLGLNAEFVKEVFTKIFEESKKVQAKELK